MATLDCEFPLTYRGTIIDCVDRAEHLRAQLGQQRAITGIFLCFFANSTVAAIAVRPSSETAGRSA